MPSGLEMGSGQKFLTLLRLGQNSPGQENYPQKRKFSPKKDIFFSF